MTKRTLSIRHPHTYDGEEIYVDEKGHTWGRPSAKQWAETVKEKDSLRHTVQKLTDRLESTIEKSRQTLEFVVKRHNIPLRDPETYLRKRPND